MDSYRHRCFGFILIGVLTFFLLVGSVPAYMTDDFSGEMIDSSKYTVWEFVRGIKDGKLESRVARYGSMKSNSFTLQNPGAVNTLVADVTVTEVANIDARLEAKLSGFFYDSTTDGGKTIYATVGIVHTPGGGLRGFWTICKFPIGGTTGWDCFIGGEPWGIVGTGDTKTLSLSWDGGTVFTFGFEGGTDQIIDVGTEAPNTGPATIVSRSLSTTCLAGPGGVANIDGYISATFDNVYINESTTAYDDFEATDGAIDPTKWRTWEFVRDANNGVLESALTRYGTNGSNYLFFADAERIKGFQADVTVTMLINNFAFPLARLAGAFYNDGSPGGGRAGDVVANVALVPDGGGGLRADCYLSRCTGGDCNLPGEYQLIYNSTLSTSLELNTPYTLSVFWDEASNEFTFGLDGTYHLAAFPVGNKPPIAGPPLFGKGIGTRVSSIDNPLTEGAFISATFDNLVVLGELDDTDGDGIFDVFDNCPNDSNADQLDTDRDGMGDVCDLDGDNDTIPDVSDNCSLVYNLDQTDRDSDTIGDACDNCPDVSNSGQDDTDGDGVGNACEGFNEEIVVPSTNLQPGEPIWVTATFKNQSSQSIDTIKPDCFNCTFTVKDTSGNILPPRYRLRMAYGIPKDIVTIPALSDFSVACNLSEMYHPTVLTSGAGGSPINYTVEATYANDIVDPDIDPYSGDCTGPDNECYYLWSGSVSSTPQTVTISGSPVTEDTGTLIVQAELHTVGPGSTKEPIPDMEIRVFDKSVGSCAAGFGISWHHYPEIWNGTGTSAACEPVPEATTNTDSNGQAIFALPEGDYLVIGYYEPDESYIGKSVGEIIAGSEVTKYLKVTKKD